MSVQERQSLLRDAAPVASPSPTASSGSAGMLGSFVNLTNTILGAGILSVPFALSQSGLVLGLMFLVAIWLFSSLSFDVLARAAHYTSFSTYKDIALSTWGTPLAYVSEVCIMLYTFLNLVARPIIVAEYLIAVFALIAPNTVLVQRWFIILIMGILVFPLTALRNIDALKTPGVTARLVHVREWPDSPSAFISFGILVVSFCAHYNMPRMYSELEARSPQRMRVVIFCSTTFCLVLYTVVGTFGYLTCLSFTQGNVLDDYGIHVPIVTVARAALVVALVFSTPLVLFACRRSFLAVFLPSKRDNPHILLWTGISLTILVVTSIIAYFLPSIDVVFGFSGSVVGTTFVYCIPGLFFIRLARNFRASDGPLLSLNSEERPFVRPSPNVLLATGLLLLFGGLVLGVMGTVGSVWRIVFAPSTNITCFNMTGKAVPIGF